MSNFNSLVPFIKPTLKDLADAGGITQFASDGFGWFQVLNGLIIQGGFYEHNGAPAPHTVSFHTAFPKQVLGVFLQQVGAGSNAYLTTVTLEDFIVDHGGTHADYYWWAIGV